MHDQWAEPMSTSHDQQPSGSNGPMRCLAPAGGDQPHNNMQPYLTFYFCIALQGRFPAPHLSLTSLPKVQNLRKANFPMPELTLRPITDV